MGPQFKVTSEGLEMPRIKPTVHVLQDQPGGLTNRPQRLIR